MSAARSFRQIVSGERRGFGAAAARAILSAAERPYIRAMNWRNARYDRRPASIFTATIPVVSIGNLTTGGVGKTPFVRWIAAHLLRQGKRVAILSRGYGAKNGQPNDEALELAAALPEVPHLQNPDRTQSIRTAITNEQTEVALLDDGFQHRRLARDLDIVLLDALSPFGFDRVFPRGMLREPKSGLARADAVLLTRADLVSEKARETVRREVKLLAPNALWCEVTHRPTALANCSGERISVSTLAERPVAAFCAIGNPAGFRRTLETSGLAPNAWREFDDHYDFSADDLASLTRWAAEAPVDAILCTKKDLVKMNVDQLGSRPLWALEIEIEFLTGQREFELLLDGALASKLAK